MASSGHVAFYPAFAQIEGRGVHTLQIFAIFVYFALVPSHALGASTSRAATLFSADSERY